MKTFECCLTHRHGWHDLESIYPDNFISMNDPNKDALRLKAWFQFVVPDDVEELIVHMSGFKLYRKHLIKMAHLRGLKFLTLIWGGNGSKKPEFRQRLQIEGYVAKERHKKGKEP